MDLNVKGMFHCARGAVPWMERQGRGVILNTSSMVSFYGQPAGVAYPVSKFAVNGFTLSLARELAPKGIRVNAVAPGIIETDMLRAVPREVLAPLEAQIPLGRVGQPGEVAEASYSWPRSRHPISPAWSSGWTDWPGPEQCRLRPLSPRGTGDVQLLAVFGHGTAGDGAALLRQQGA